MINVYLKSISLKKHKDLYFCVHAAVNSVGKYIYSNTILKYLNYTWVFLFYVTLYFYSTTSQREILYF